MIIGKSVSNHNKARWVLVVEDLILNIFFHQLSSFSWNNSMDACVEGGILLECHMHNFVYILSKHYISHPVMM